MHVESAEAGPSLTILTEEEFDAEKEKGVLLLQLGSEKCTRCPAFHAAIAKLTESHNFIWAYCDAHHQDTDLPELFSVTQLPAFVLYNPRVGTEQQVVVANASPEQVKAVVFKECAPKLITDADF